MHLFEHMPGMGEAFRAVSFSIGPQQMSLFQLYESDVVHKPLMTSIQAVGATTFPQTAKAPHVMRTAFQCYTEALRLTNVVLQNVTTAVNDNTFHYYPFYNLGSLKWLQATARIFLKHRYL